MAKPKPPRSYLRVPSVELERLEALCVRLSAIRKQDVDTTTVLCRVMALGLTIMERQAGIESDQQGGERWTCR